MADYVYELMAKIGLDDTEFNTTLENDGQNLQSFGSRLGSGLKTAGKAAAAGIAAATTATVALGTAVVKSAGETAAYGDNIDKMSQKMGMSAEAYQEWDAIMQHSGTSMESLQASMKTLASAAETGKDSFDKLGISQEQIANMSQEELFSATITALQNVSSETERTYLAGQLLGRGATELGALLNTSAEDTQAMRDRLHELGGVMSDEAVKAAAHYQDSLQDMQTAFQGLQRNLTSEFLPGITGVMDGLAEVFIGNNETGLGMISSGIDNLGGSLAEQLPRFLELGAGIIESLASAILDNLPKLAKSAVKIILDLTQTIIKNLPKIIDAGVEILFALIDGIIDALPELIPAVVQVILTIVEKLTEPDTLMQLIDAAFKIIGAIAEGLIKAIPELIKAAPTIMLNLIEAILRFLPQFLASGVELMVQFALGIVEGGLKVVESVVELLGNLKDKFMERVENAKQWGRDLIGNFVNGIKERIGSLWSTVKSIGQGIKNFLGFSEPKEGPLSDFHTYAPDMMKLFAQGIRDNEHLITDQISKSFDFGGIATGGNLATAGNTTNTYNITVNGIEELDELLNWYNSRQVVARMA